MAIKVVSVSQLLDKDLFASAGTPINIRSVPSASGTVLRKISSGNRIGNVSTYTEGRDKDANKDGSIWLQLKEKYSNPSGFGAWVKYMPAAFDWKSLQEQGVLTKEEEIAEQAEKDKSNLDKALDGLKSAGKWLLIAWVVKSAIENKKS